MREQGKTKTALAMFVGYVWLVTMAGLALHPYKSVRQMIFEKTRRVLLPVVLSPTVTLGVFFVLGRLGSLAFDLKGMERELMALVLGWTLIGLIMWQLLILALVWRFWRGYKN